MAANGLCRSPDKDAISQPKEIFRAKSKSSGSTMAILPKRNRKLQTRLRKLTIALVSYLQSPGDSQLLWIACQLSQKNLQPQILHLKLTPVKYSNPQILSTRPWFTDEIEGMNLRRVSQTNFKGKESLNFYQKLYKPSMQLCLLTQNLLG
jgi:hypothetical protein